MDIKEIALKVADSLRNKVDGVSHMQSNQGLVRFAEALIESYKAELLNEVGEPVAYFSDEFFSVNTKQNATFNEPLFTSDQVAAAIIKATKPLEEQLAAAQEEINSPPAIGAYEMYMADDEESNPVERLRFFLSLALKDQDWIDVEKFIDDVSNHIAKAEQRVSEACAVVCDTKLGHEIFKTQSECARQIRSGEWRKFVKEM